MSFNPARQTLYALISGLEHDLRQFIKQFLANQFHIGQLFTDDVARKAFERLQSEHGNIPSEPEISDILVFVDFPDLYQALNRHRSELPSSLGSQLKDRTGAFEHIVRVRNRVAHSRPLQAEDFPRTLELVKSLIEESRDRWEHTSTTLDKLRDRPSDVLGIEIPAEEVSDEVPNNLPIPDYDETGFIGREDAIASVKKAVLGPYPVITIRGEGGVGKSALALRVAHEIAEDRNTEFDSIVWSTSKTTKLTGAEVQRIRGAIEDSLTLFKEIQSQLAGVAAADSPIDEILQYLDEFNILLILDNLETVLDERIRGFLENLPRSSKILITSRVGVGAFENPIQVRPMNGDEAVQLLRLVAYVRQVESLTQTSNRQLHEYCSRMHFNPAYIKWFVSAVQSGRRPEDVLADPSTVLDFCMENVYEGLSEAGQKVLDVLVTVPGQRSQAEIAYLADMNSLELQPTLQELMSSNMLRMHTEHRGKTYQSTYEVSELAQEYLREEHPVQEGRFRKIRKRRNELVGAKEELRQLSRKSSYSPYSVQIRSNSDVIVGKRLRDALQSVRREEFESAIDLVKEAENLAPDYHEVYRVKAWINAKKGNASAALQAYQAALELAPASPYLRRFYGGFLLSVMGNAEEAHKEFQKAADLDPESPEPTIELARTSLYTGRFAKAQNLLDKLSRRADIASRSKQIIHDLHLQYFHRRADALLQRESDAVGAVNLLEEMRDYYESIPRHLRDIEMRGTLSKAVYTAQSAARQLERGEDKELEKHARQLSVWLEANAEENTTVSASDAGTKLDGIISRLPVNESFGYVRGEDDFEYFFHRSNLNVEEHWRALAEGDGVTFVVSPDETAMDIEIDGPTDTDERLLAMEGKTLEGLIVSLKRNENFGFVRAFHGPRFFFHKSYCTLESEWDDIKEGDQVKFEVREDRDGRPAAFEIQLSTSL